MSYFPEPYTHCTSKIKVELDLFNCETKADLKNATGVDTLRCPKIRSSKIDLDELKKYKWFIEFKNLSR